MPKIGEMLGGKYLKQSDIDDETIVTVAKVGKANIAREGDAPEYKWLIRFDELPKPMVLNSTNVKRLAKACDSEDSDDWTGKQVILYVDPDVEFGGDIVGGLRIRAIKKAAPAKQLATVNEDADDVPF
jgi:hypothetical protein